MKLIIGFDGSDDGFAGLELMARTLAGGREQHEVTLVLSGWPIHISSLWDKAFERQGLVDDLHRAMAEVADIEFKRLRVVFEPVAKVETRYLEGDVNGKLAALADQVRPDMILLGTSREAHVQAVGAFLRQTMKDLPYPVVIAHGPRSS